MLFFGSINGVFGHQVHGLAATDQLTSAGMQDFNNVSTECAFVYFVYFSHCFSPQFEEFLAVSL
jgi:hypothetical protein